MKHILQLAWRGYVRERAFTGLNLLSLTIGLFVAYVAVHYLRFEWGYDRFHKNARSVYRLAWTYRSQDYSVIGFANGDAATAAGQQRQLNAIKTATGVVDAVQFITSDVPTFVEANGRTIQTKGLLTTNTPRSFCSVFSWPLQEGSFQDFGNGTQTAILTNSTARLLFGDDVGKAVQQRVKVGADYYTVAAVIADVPANSHVDFTMVLNTPQLSYWGSRVYVQTAESADPEQVMNQINRSLAAFNPKQASDPLYKRHFLQPLTSLHLGSDILYELKPPGNRLYLLLIACFAVCIGVITLVNYANLSLAIKAKQSKSLGVRKAMGASNGSIAAQFWVEGVLLALLALPLVGLLVALLTPAFNRLMGVAVPTNILADPLALPLLMGLAVGLGTLASTATVAKLASKRALALVNETMRSPQQRAIPVRTYLVVSQFALLIGLMAVSYFIGEQLRFVDGKELGFRREGVLYVYSAPEVQDVFQAKLRQLPGVKAVGNGSSFGIEPFNQVTYKLQESAEVFDDARQLYLDPYALRAYGLKTTLSPRSGTARPALAGLPEPYTLINRTAAEKLAAKARVPVEAIIGRTVVTEPEYIDENRRAGIPFTVAGIFEDIHLFSLHKRVEPYFITVSSKLRMDGRTIVQYDPATTEKTLAGIRDSYKSLKQQSPLEVEFLAENVANLYRKDRQIADLLGYFTVIAMLLAAIGTVGITIFLTVARTKEIGIRKVLGASAWSIVRSATNEYVHLVGAALLLGAPVAVYVVRSWLANFAYHVAIQPVVLAGIGLLVLVFASSLVGLIAYRASLANPVKSLRSE